MRAVDPELTDAENPEWTEEMFAKAKRGSAASKMGRPKAAITKKQVSVRLSRNVITFFQKEGKGWQTRLNDALEEYVAKH